MKVSKLNKAAIHFPCFASLVAYFVRGKNHLPLWMSKKKVIPIRIISSLAFLSHPEGLPSDGIRGFLFRLQSAFW